MGMVLMSSPDETVQATLVKDIAAQSVANSLHSSAQFNSMPHFQNPTGPYPYHGHGHPHGQNPPNGYYYPQQQQYHPYHPPPQMFHHPTPPPHHPTPPPGQPSNFGYNPPGYHPNVAPHHAGHGWHRQDSPPYDAVRFSTESTQGWHQQPPQRSDSPNFAVRQPIPMRMSQQVDFASMEAHATHVRTSQTFGQGNMFNAPGYPPNVPPQMNHAHNHANAAMRPPSRPSCSPKSKKLDKAKVSNAHPSSTTSVGNNNSNEDTTLMNNDSDEPTTIIADDSLELLAPKATDETVVAEPRSGPPPSSSSSARKLSLSGRRASRYQKLKHRRHFDPRDSLESIPETPSEHDGSDGIESPSTDTQSPGSDQRSDSLIIDGTQINFCFLF